MKYDEEIRDRILLQVYQCDEFVTDRKNEAWHAALLIDDGYVDGEIVNDSVTSAVQSVKIHRMKRKGYEKVNAIIHNPDGAPDCSDFRKRLGEMIHKSEESHDRLIATLSAGGIGLFFTFLGLISKSSREFTFSREEYAFGGLALLCWVLALILLLVSHFKSISITERMILAIDANNFDAEESNRSRKMIGRINVVNAVLTIAGIVAFSVFTVFVLTKWQNNCAMSDMPVRI